MNWPIGLRLGIGFPMGFPYIHEWTFDTILGLEKPNYQWYKGPRGGTISDKREAIADGALRDGCTHILFLDSDMIYPPLIVREMLEVMEDQEAHMIGGLCYRGYEPFDPLVWHPTEEKLLIPFRDYQFGDIVDSGQTGCACLMIKREVFEVVSKPWFTEAFERKRVGDTIVQYRRGEDTYFTRKATKDFGFKLKVITTYDIGHIRETAVDRHFWLTYGILSKLGDWDRVANLFLKLNDPNWVKREFETLKNKEGKEEQNG